MTGGDTIYIVTGCTGYVGNVLTKTLLRSGMRVIGLARNPGKVTRVFGANPPEIIYGDIRNPEDVKKLFAEDAEYIILHTVAYVTIGEGSEETLFSITVKGTENLLKEAANHRVKKFLQISSTDAIPRGTVIRKDLSNYNPCMEPDAKGYAGAKRAADALVLTAVREQGLDASILMFASVLGPGDYSHSHMTQVLADFMEGKLPASVDAGYNNFDIRDVAAVLPAIIEHAQRGEIYLFAASPAKINEIFGYLAQAYHKRMPPTLPMWVAYVGLPFLLLWAKITGKRPLYTRAALESLKVDVNFPIQKAEKAFGYHPRPLRETVLDHVQFLFDQGMLPQK